MMGPYRIGSKTWPGLSKLIEECGEVLQVSGKLIGRSGEIDHWDGTNLRERLTEELGDLLAAATFFVFHNLDRSEVERRAQMKLETFNEWHRKDVG